MNIFEGAKFGDRFILRNGKQAIYHRCEIQTNGEIWHYLIVEPEPYVFRGKSFVYAPYETYVDKDGKGYPESLKLSDLESPNSPNYEFVIVKRITDPAKS